MTSIYSDKLAHVQVVINCQYSVAQLCTREDTLAHILGALYFDVVMSYNSLTTNTMRFLMVLKLQSDKVLKQLCAMKRNPELRQRKESGIGDHQSV